MPNTHQTKNRAARKEKIFLRQEFIKALDKFYPPGWFDFWRSAEQRRVVLIEKLVDSFFENETTTRRANLKASLENGDLPAIREALTRARSILMAPQAIDYVARIGKKEKSVWQPESRKFAFLSEAEKIFYLLAHALEIADFMAKSLPLSASNGSFMQKNSTSVEDNSAAGFSANVNVTRASAADFFSSSAYSVVNGFVSGVSAIWQRFPSLELLPAAQAAEIGKESGVGSAKLMALEEKIKNISDEKIKEFYREIFKRNPILAEKIWQEIKVSGVLLGRNIMLSNTIKRPIIVAEKDRQLMFAYMFARTLLYPAMENKNGERILFYSAMEMIDYAGVKTQQNFMFADRLHFFIRSIETDKNPELKLEDESYENLHIDAVVEIFRILGTERRASCFKVVKLHCLGFYEMAKSSEANKSPKVDQDFKRMLPWIKALKKIEPNLTAEERKTVDWNLYDSLLKKIEKIISDEKAESSALKRAVPVISAVAVEDVSYLSKSQKSFVVEADKAVQQNSAAETNVRSDSVNTSNYAVIIASFVGVIGVMYALREKNAELEIMKQEKENLQGQIRIAGLENARLEILLRNEKQTKTAEIQKKCEEVRGQIRSEFEEKTAVEMSLVKDSFDKRMDKLKADKAQQYRTLLELGAQIAAVAAEREKILDDFRAAKDEILLCKRKYAQQFSLIKNCIELEFSIRSEIANSGNKLPNKLSNNWDRLGLSRADELGMVVLLNRMVAAKLRSSARLLHNFAMIHDEDGIGTDDFKKEKLALRNLSVSDIKEIDQLTDALKKSEDVVALSRICMPIQQDKTLAGAVICGIRDIAGAAAARVRPQSSAAGYFNLRYEQEFLEELQRVTGLKCDVRDVVRFVCRELIGDLQCLRSSVECELESQELGSSASAAASGASAAAGPASARDIRGQKSSRKKHGKQSENQDYAYAAAHR